MKKSKQQIEAALVFAKDDDKFYFFEELDTKEKRTLAQNRVFYRLFNGISKHLGYDTQEVKIYMLSGCFGTHKIKLSKTEMDIPNISHTSDLTKEQGIFFIETILTFVKMKNVPIEITPREIQSLYDSYEQ